MLYKQFLNYILEFFLFKLDIFHPVEILRFVISLCVCVCVCVIDFSLVFFAACRRPRIEKKNTEQLRSSQAALLFWI